MSQKQLQRYRVMGLVEERRITPLSYNCMKKNVVERRKNKVTK